MERALHHIHGQKSTPAKRVVNFAPKSAPEPEVTTITPRGTKTVQPSRSHNDTVNTLTQIVTSDYTVDKYPVFILAKPAKKNITIKLKKPETDNMFIVIKDAAGTPTKAGIKYFTTVVGESEDILFDDRTEIVMKDPFQGVSLLWNSLENKFFLH